MQDYVGYRTQKRLSQKKKKKKVWRWLVALAALIVIFVILGAAVRIYPFDKAWDKTADGFVWLGGKIKSVWPWKKKVRVEPEKFLPEGKKTANYLLAVTKQVNGSTWLSTLVLASYDSRNENGSLIYFPNDLLVNVPGVGTDTLSNLVELDEGRMSMSLVTVENLVGIEVDRYIMGSDRDLSIIFSKLGGSYQVDVPERVSFEDPSLKVSVDLKSGKQDLEGRKLASYLTYSVPGKELELIKRQEGFVPLFLDRSRGDYFNDIETYTKKYANLFDSDASNKEMAGMWQAFALLKGKKFQQGTLPVKEFRLEKTVAHRVDQEKLASFIKKYVKTDFPMQSSLRVRVEILNGCGAPGTGGKVASTLDLYKFQVVNSANADNFNYAETVIVVYSNDKKVLSAASEIRNSLEVGRVEAHPKSQDISDITVIIGKDYTSK